jgi:hypothetical protein
MKFDLMKHKPKLDTETLNYVWHMLWRSNYVTKGKNENERIRVAERKFIMKRLEELVDDEEV